MTKHLHAHPVMFAVKEFVECTKVHVVLRKHDRACAHLYTRAILFSLLLLHLRALLCCHKSHLLSLTMPTPQSAKQRKNDRWSNRTKAHKMLKEGMEDGTIDANQKPKDVYDSNPEFLKYPLQSFRSAFNRIKAELGVHVHDEGKVQ